MILPQNGASFTPRRVVVVPTLTHLRPNEALNLTADAAESACARWRIVGIRLQVIASVMWPGTDMNATLLLCEVDVS